MRIAAKGGGLEGWDEHGGGGKGRELGGEVIGEGDLVQLRGGRELGRELRLRETFLAELSRCIS